MLHVLLNLNLVIYQYSIEDNATLVEIYCKYITNIQ